MDILRFLKTHRRETIISGLMGALLLAVTIGNFGFVKSVDRDYSALLSSQGKCRDALYRINRESGSMQRSLLNMLLAESPAEMTVQKSVVLESARRVDKEFSRLDKLQEHKTGRDLLSKLSEKSLAYRQLCTQFSVVVESGDRTAALALNKTELYPAFLQYQALQERVIAYVDSSMSAQSVSMTTKTNRLGLFTILVALFPFAAWILAAASVIIYLLTYRDPGKNTAYNSD